MSNARRPRLVTIRSGHGIRLIATTTTLHGPWRFEPDVTPTEKKSWVRWHRLLDKLIRRERHWRKRARPLKCVGVVLAGVLLEACLMASVHAEPSTVTIPARCAKSLLQQGKAF